jgi:hypothetical protein
MSMATEYDTQDQAADEMTIVLRKPIMVGTETYREIRLREPTADEMMQWDKLSGTEADIMAISLVSGTPRAVVSKMGARDLLQGARFVARFLG